MRRLGFDPHSILDIGASDGRWTLGTMAIFPQAQYLLVEARQDCMPLLERITDKHANIHVVQTLVGDRDRDVPFNLHGFQSSIFGNAEGKGFGDITTAQMSTVDQVSKLANFPPPQLIKLDIQGAELLALAGAAEALHSTECVVTEVSFIPFQKGIPIAHEVVRFMADRDFVIYDLAEIGRRPLDGALIQASLFFLKRSSPLLADVRYGQALPWS